MERVTGKSILVTGGAGFIGSHLCDRILSLDPERLTIVDDFSLGKKANILQILDDDRVTVANLDASDYSKMLGLLKREACDVAFNLAVVPLPRSLVEPKATVDTNVSITTTMCEMLRLGLVRTLVHTSSSEAYGSAIYVPMDEKHPEQPLTPYAASKVASDHVVMSYSQTFDLDVALVRPFNTYGPRQNELSYAGVIPATIRRIMSGKEPVIYGDGLQTRDYTFVADTVEGILGVYGCEEARGKIINIATGKEITIRHIIREISRTMGYRGKILHEPARAGDVRRHRGDIRLAKRLFHFAPKVDFERGLLETVRWYQAQAP